LRLLGLILGACLLGEASFALAAPPILPWKEIASGRGPAAAARLREAHAAARTRGLDEAARVTLADTTHYRALVILLQFSDQPADTIGHPPAAYEDLLFSVGTHPTGSMRDYYREVSRDQFDISGVVTSWYTAPRTYAQYTSGFGGFGSTPNNAQQMAQDAVLLAEADYDMSLFDNDGPDGIPDSGDDDGTVDALFIVHAGPGGEETGNQNDIWSHKWNLPAGYASPDGVFLFPYTTEPEEWAGSVPFTTAGDLISIGVFCHEFGHVLGLPDIYDTQPTSSPDANEGVGEWDIMASGLYNHLAGEALASSPAHFSAWSLERVGWVAPIWVLGDSLGVAIPPVATSGQVFRLWTNGEEDAEYFLLENRQPIGFDAGLVRSSVEGGNGPAHGLLIYHIDGSVIGQANPTRKMIDVEEGGGVRIPSGFIGEQNLDTVDGRIVTQDLCGGSPNVVGNRGDAYDPWPGLGNRTHFESLSCPNSNRNCGGLNTQVAVRNIVENAGTITADFLVSGIQVKRLLAAVDDAPAAGTPNNGNGLLESGETVMLRFPITNVGSIPTGPLHALIRSTEPYLALFADSINYASLSPGATDSGMVVPAEVTLAPDPIGSSISFSLRTGSSEVISEEFQILIGVRSGICENFEGGPAVWRAEPSGCEGANEWHLETGLGANHTPLGSWSWKLGPFGPVGGYATSQDARLISPPIRLASANEELRFFHKYDSEFVFDGGSVEISTDAASTWLPIVPLGGYPTGDRYSGTRSVYGEAIFPLTGYTGVVQIAFRFRAVPPNDGLGWYIDDVTVSGDAPCAPVEAAIERFTAAAVEGASPPRVLLEWTVPLSSPLDLSVERALPEAAPVVLVTLPNFGGSGSIEDAGVLPGATYDYYLRGGRPGLPDVLAGPLRVSLPNPSPPMAPRVLALSSIRPNPFHPSAGMAVSLDRDGPFMVRIYRTDGRLVRTMRFPTRPAGTHPATWDGRDDRGQQAAAGLYLFELRFGGRTRVQKAVLLR